MLSIMREERRGVLSVIIRFFLTVVASVYYLAIKVVDRAYSYGVRKVYKFPVPVISVGNITLGGTGKTPFTVFIVDHLIAIGRKPAVLTRGYGDDEHNMLKDAVPGLMVFPGQDRVRNVRKAVEQGADVLVLDDGFQHRRIERDLDILLLDCPYPSGKYRLFPRGTLREPVSSIRRADIVVLTKVDRINRDEKEEIVRKINDLASGVPVVTVKHEPVLLTDVTGAAYPLDDIKGKKVYLVSGIADPGYFAYTVKKTEAVITGELIFTDHHRYTRADIDGIHAKCFSASVEVILTTEKDYVKLKELDLSRIEEKLFILRIRVDITEGRDRFVAGLDRVMSR
ncbi:MAG: tetraacyldisaccharide 4'-kinase [Candidatus Omnitrophica bacterium]|nr:tetraacyldisaccharide 4'-kinase [Candidatus Omnitrophota bacterium]